MSMNCPRCGNLARCHNSKRTQDGSVRRYFACPECTCRFSSVETITRVKGFRLDDLVVKHLNQKQEQHHEQSD